MKISISLQNFTNWPLVILKNCKLIPIFHIENDPKNIIKNHFKTPSKQKNLKLTKLQLNNLNCL